MWQILADHTRGKSVGRTCPLGAYCLAGKLMLSPTTDIWVENKESKTDYPRRTRSKEARKSVQKLWSGPGQSWSRLPLVLSASRGRRRLNGPLDAVGNCTVISIWRENHFRQKIVIGIGEGEGQWEEKAGILTLPWKVRKFEQEFYSMPGTLFLFRNSFHNTEDYGYSSNIRAAVLLEQWVSNQLCHLPQGLWISAYIPKTWAGPA